MSVHHRTVPRVCQKCGKDFLARASHVAAGWGNYCSIPCTRSGAGEKRRRSAAERFWRSVLKTETCWLWTGGKVSKGYGLFRLDASTTICTHRFSWELHHGPIPDGLQVLHNCPDGDNPACVNPAHLWLGTNDDNVADKVAKDRQVRGVGIPHAVLTEDLVRDMRARVASGEATVVTLCDELPLIGRTTIQSAVTGKSWKHV